MRNVYFPEVMKSHFAHNVERCVAEKRDKLKPHAWGGDFKATTPEPFHLRFINFLTSDLHSLETL